MLAVHDARTGKFITDPEAARAEIRKEYAKLAALPIQEEEEAPAPPKGKGKKSVPTPTPAPTSASKGKGKKAEDVWYSYGNGTVDFVGPENLKGDGAHARDIFFECLEDATEDQVLKHYKELDFEPTKPREDFLAIAKVTCFRSEGGRNTWRARRVSTMENSAG